MVYGLGTDFLKNVHLKYNSFNELLKKKFGQKINRLSLNLGLGCPHRDETNSLSGCLYCNEDSLLAKTWHKQQSLKEQIEYGKTYIKDRHNTDKYLAYFQNGSNTNAPAEKLYPLFKEAGSYDKIVGLVISTRPDCIDNDIIDMLSLLNSQTYLWVEMGLQSTQNRILKKINRGHTVEKFIKAVETLAQRDIKTCAHIIFGLPDETKEEILDGINLINKLPINGIKIHNLFVTKNTQLANWYEKKKYTPLSLKAYATLCVDYLERLRPDITIHRLNAHAPDRYTLAPKWSVNKWETLNAVHQEILKRDTFQGRLYRQ